MFKGCCLECGNLLFQKRHFCPFCGWNLQGEQLVDNLESDYRLHDLNTEDIEPDQFFASNRFQSGVA